MISAVRLLITLFLSFLKSVISITCFLKDSQNFFMQYLPLNTLRLFSVILNDDIVDIKKAYEMCLPNFVVHEFIGLSLHIHQSFLLNIQDLHKY